MRRGLAAIVLALTLAPAAAAHVDDPAQLAFEWPAQGRVTTPFGWTAEGRWHAGLDIGSLQSLEVRAAAPGRVRLVGTPAGFLGYGNVVLVALGGPFETVYAHLASARVSPGDTVDAGEQIGVAGCTGWCTGTHLHFELRERGQAIDPSFLLPAFGAGSIWVTNREGRTVQRISPATNRVTKALRFPGGGKPAGIAFSRGGSGSATTSGRR